jgi:WD40 repeat protein
MIQAPMEEAAAHSDGLCEGQRRAFVGREWLIQRVLDALDQPEIRGVILLGSPGVGKTAFMAHLTAKHPDWLHYFVRRDGRTVLRPGDARTFLLSIGEQLAARHPEAFEARALGLNVTQMVQHMAPGSEAIGIRVGDLRPPPFSGFSATVSQQIGALEGRSVGIQIDRLVLDYRVYSVHDLLALMLVEPLKRLARAHPSARIVVLIDAVDESTFSLTADEQGIVQAVAEVFEMEDLQNLRFIISSRPGGAVASLTDRANALCIDLDVCKAENSSDIAKYLGTVIPSPDRQQTRLVNEAYWENIRARVLYKSSGNFLYAHSLVVALDGRLTAGETQDPDLEQYVDRVPPTLYGLYAHFLRQIGAWSLKAIGPQAWTGSIRPLLGCLAIAKVPLRARQAASLGELPLQSVRDMLHELRQFLVEEVDPAGQRTYRLYHASFAEFLTDYDANSEYWVDTVELHKMIASAIIRTENTSSGFLQQIETIGPFDDRMYGIKFVTTHLLEIPDYEAAARVLVNPCYIDSRVRSDHAVALLDEYLALSARKALPEITKTLLNHLETTIATNLDFLSAHSHEFFQCAWNLNPPSAPPNQRSRGGGLRRILRSRNPRDGAMRSDTEPVGALLAEWHELKRRCDSVVVWLRSTRPPIYPIPPGEYVGHRSTVCTITVSADGTRLASGSDDGDILIWSAASKRRLAVVNAHDGGATEALVFLADGRCVSAGGRYPRTVAVWSPKGQNWELQFRVQGPRGTITSLGHLLGSTIIYASAQDGSVWMWAAQNGELRAKIDAHSKTVQRAIPTANGEGLLTIGEGNWNKGDGAIRFWRASDGSLIEEICPKHRFGRVCDVQISPDGTLLGVLTGFKLELLSRSSGRLLREIKASGHRGAISFSPDGQSLTFLSSYDGQLHRFCVRSGRSLGSWPAHAMQVATRDHEGGYTLASHGDALFSSGDTVVRRWSNFVSYWDKPSREDHRDLVRSLAFSPDSKLLASVGYDAIKIWSTSSGSVVSKLNTKWDAGSSPGDCVFAEDGAVVLVPEPNALRKFSSVNGHLTRTLSYNFGQQLGTQILTSSNSSIAAVWDGYTIVLWDLQNHRALRALNCCDRGVGSQTYNVALSADGARVAYGSVKEIGPNGLLRDFVSDKYRVRVVETSSGRELHQLRGHTNTITCVAFSGDRQIVASGSLDGTIRVYDAGTGELQAVLRDLGTGIVRLYITPQGLLIASEGRHQRTTSVWRLSDGKLLRRVAGWAVLGRRDLALVENHQITLTDTESGTSIGSLPHGASEKPIVALSPDDRILAVCVSNRLDIYQLEREAKT